MGMVLYNKSTGEVLARELRVARRFLERFKGLMFTRSFPGCGGLIIRPCGGVHTFFMRYPLDVLLMDEHNRVLYKEVEMPPNKMTPYFSCSQTAVELPAGSLAQRNVSLGDELQLLFEKPFESEHQ